MIHFEHIEYLWLLAGVALLGLLWVLMSWREQRRRERWADREMWGRLIPDRRKWRPVTKGILTLLGMSLVVVALANPQLGKKEEKGKRSGSDIAVCIDVSNSMMAEDVKPNRLTRCKQAVQNLLNSMMGDHVSLIVFAGTSFIEMPLTNDYNAAKLFLEQVDCQMVPTQGTAIGDAIEKAMATFGYGDEEREWKTNNSRAIIIISDGENHEDDAIGAAKKAYKEGIRVCTIGLGSTQGTPIPSGRNGSFRRDSEGNVIITKLNEQMLKDIAEAGKGVYVNGNNGIDDITTLLEDLEKNDFDEAVFNTYESRYQYPLLAGLLCLLAEVIIFERRNKKWRMIFVFAFLFMGTAQGQTPSPINFSFGNIYYIQKQYLEAAEQYSKALEDTTLSDEHRSKTLYNLGNCLYHLGRENEDNQTLETAEKCYTEALALSTPQTLKPSNHQTLYNLGNSLYQQKRYLEAAEQYNEVLSYPDLSDEQRAKTMYNLGNSLLKESLSSYDTATLKTAISCYRNALRLEPKNENYRYNQTLAYRLLDKLTKQNKMPQQKQQQKNQQDKQQQQQQQQKQQQNQKQQDQQKQQQNQQQQKNQQQNQSEQQKQEQKKQNDSKDLKDEVNRELQRQQQNQQQKNQQQQGQKQQNQQQGQKQQQKQQQNQQQQGQQQGQNPQTSKPSNPQTPKGQDGKQGQNPQTQKQDNKKLNDEIKKELERQKKGEKSDKQPEKKGEKGKGDQGENQKQHQKQNQQTGNPQSGKPNNKQQTPNTQQGTVLTGKKLDPDKKNAVYLLEAVKNNERKTIKTQIINAQPSKENHSGKEW